VQLRVLALVVLVVLLLVLMHKTQPQLLEQPDKDQPGALVTLDCLQVQVAAVEREQQEQPLLLPFLVLVDKETFLILQTLTELEFNEGVVVAEPHLAEEAAQVAQAAAERVTYTTQHQRFLDLLILAVAVAVGVIKLPDLGVLEL
jgi:hypothetical protein